MRTKRYILLMTLALLIGLAGAQTKPASPNSGDTEAAAATTRLLRVPVAFCRSGKKATVRMPMLHNKPMETLVLRAFGRVWTPPVKSGVDERGNWVADFNVPAVRVTTVFSITDASNAKLELGQLVAYPGRDVDWNEKITLYAAGAPKWFNQWSKAAGLPVKQIALKDTTADKLRPSDDKSKALLIVGRSDAGRGLGDVRKLADDKKVNVLVLGAKWFSGSHKPVSIRPRMLTGPLADMSSQRWAEALPPARRNSSNRILSNRWPFVIADDVPLVEAAGSLNADARAVLSLIEWPELLGRSEQADELLLAVLRTAAGFKPAEKPLRRGVLIHPKSVKYDPKTMGYCPALSLLNKGPDKPTQEAAEVFIVDLRGKEPAPDDLWRKLTTMNLTGSQRLLLLGDDAVLDQCRWLKLNRRKGTAANEAVVWLKDDTPWNKTYEAKLMITLTELAVPLGVPDQLEKE